MRRATKPPNLLTIDVEEWYHVNYTGVDVSRLAAQPTHLEELVDRLLRLCDEGQVRATCFILGSVAREKPRVVARLHAAGHEIASHGDAHKSVHSMTPDEFRADLARSCDALEQITGEKVLGFRAPSFSVTASILAWFYPVMEELGIRYSSSVFPGRTFLYGIPDFPRDIHYPQVGGRRTEVLEIPMPRIDLFGQHMGLYLRFFPRRFILEYMERANRAGRHVVLYVHPREIDIDQPKLPLNFFQGLIHYWGVKGCDKKLAWLFRRVPSRWETMRDILP